jgi:hypothetical protein
LVPNLNQVLKSSQASIKTFTSKKVDHFLEEKENADRSFQNYLRVYREMLINPLAPELSFKF